MQRKTKTETDSGAGPCARCKKKNATHFVDVKAAVILPVQKMCTRCTNLILVAFPASSAVKIPIYEVHNQ